MVSFMKENDVDSWDGEVDVARGSRRLASRFQALIGWEKSDHPVVIFKSGQGSKSDEISGIDILSLNRNRRSVGDVWNAENVEMCWAEVNVLG